MELPTENELNILRITKQEDGIWVYLLVDKYKFSNSTAHETIKNLEQDGYLVFDSEAIGLNGIPIKLYKLTSEGERVATEFQPAIGKDKRIEPNSKVFIPAYNNQPYAISGNGIYLEISTSGSLVNFSQPVFLYKRK